jgi:hypothetical protein
VKKMNREKSTGGKTKLRFKLTFITLILITIILSACPPLEEDPYDNNLVYDGPLDLIKWMEILYDIQIRGIPVNLDLSACTVPVSGADVLKHTHENGEDYTSSTGGDDYIQFDPFPGFQTGKELIRSLILPEAATMIRNAIDIDIKVIDDDDKKKSAFRHFTNLRSITGENIRLIGALAFIDCKTLEKADFSRAVHIMQYAFNGCTSLKDAHFEVARDIQISSFEDCVNLERAIFPYAGTISQRAFKNCGKLTEVNFDVATRIGDEAFRDCTGLKYARFRANPERKPENANLHPLQPWLDVNAPATHYSSGVWDDGFPKVVKTPYISDSVVFLDSAFRGCTSLEILDVRYAWNVYFSAGALADIGEHLELFLFDDKGTKSYGHPQIDMFLGDIEGSEKNGRVTLKTLLIRVPVVTPPKDSQIIFDSSTPGMAGIKSYINSTYNGDDRDEDNEPLKPLVKVIVQEYY